MVKCPECKKDMSSASTTSCTHPYMKIGNKVFTRNTSYFDVNKRCHDCNIVNKKGNIHHFGCDMERCPQCKGQMIACNCKGSKKPMLFKPNAKQQVRKQLRAKRTRGSTPIGSAEWIKKETGLLG